MKTIYTALLLWAVTSIAHAAPGDTTPMNYCNFITNYAEAVAYDRDHGTDRWTATMFLENDQTHLPEAARRDLAEVIREIHMRPHLSIQAEGERIFEACWNVYGTSS